MNINVGSITVEQKRIIHPVIPHIAGSRLFTADKGVISAGRIMTEVSGSLVPCLVTEDEDMTGLVNGTNKVYTYAAGKPICPGSVVITHGDQEVTDDGTGGLQGDGSGTVHYDTGDVSVTLDAAPAESSGAPVISLVDDPECIALDKVNTVAGADASGLVLTFGAVVSKEVNLGEDAVTAGVKQGHSFHTVAR